MAALADEPVGRTFGYATRLDSKRSAATRVTVVTEGILTARLQADPELSGVSAILFDEVHERSLDGDFGLALALDAQAGLRPDLRVVAMSATLDGARFAALMDDAPVIESEGRSYPLTLRHVGRAGEQRIEQAMAGAIRQALAEEQGGVLAFLPGAAEIERTATALGDVPGVTLHRLHGSLDPAAQRAAIRAEPDGARKLVLATSIAETSLTLDGIRVVVDSGLARRPRYDRAAGMTRLVTERESQAAATQRAGRAARQGPGVAYRLWEEAAHAGRPAFDSPEMTTSDLAPLVLSLARWGAGDPAAMAWLDPPPAPSLTAARARLMGLGALGEDGRITPHGEAMAALPLEPPLAHMLLFAAAHGVEDEAARLALLLQERNLGGHGEDLAGRMERWIRDRSGRAEASRKLAARWARAARGLRQAQPERRWSEQPASRRHQPTPAQAELVGAPALTSAPTLGILLAEAFPDNLARTRGASGEDWLTAGGRGLRLDPASPLARAAFLAVGEAQGEAKGARITGAIALSEAEIERWLAPRIERRTSLRWHADEGRAEALAERRLGALVLARGPDPAPDPAAITAFLCDRVCEGGLVLLPLSDAARALLRRAAFAGIEPLSDAALFADLDTWLAPLLGRRLRDIAPAALHEALRERLEYHARQRLDRLAPPEFVSPAGTHHAIDYAHEGGPSVEVRVQALFGLDRHPMFGDPPAPLLLKLTSPAGRPLQTTRDLPGFWRGSWREVQREMKGRYPRHRWPDEPWREDPSLKTRNAFERGRQS
jgi:ATP-dependent helicase HrpB